MSVVECQLSMNIKWMRTLYSLYLAVLQVQFLEKVGGTRPSVLWCGVGLCNFNLSTNIELNLFISPLRSASTSYLQHKSSQNQRVGAWWHICSYRPLITTYLQAKYSLSNGWWWCLAVASAGEGGSPNLLTPWEVWACRTRPTVHRSGIWKESWPSVWLQAGYDGSKSGLSLLA